MSICSHQYKESKLWFLYKIDSLVCLITYCRLKRYNLKDYTSHYTIINPMTSLAFQTQLTVLSSVVEDIGCRYSLACSKLRSLLNPLLMSPTAPTGPNSSSGLSEPPSIGSRDADLERKITQAYQVS